MSECQGNDAVVVSVLLMSFSITLLKLARAY